MKTCSKCKQEKEDWEFSPNKNRSDGLQTRCKECFNKWQKENRRNSYLQHRYGITEIQYELMLKSQNGVCVICGQPETAKLKMIKSKL